MLKSEIKELLIEANNGCKKAQKEIGRLICLQSSCRSFMLFKFGKEFWVYSSCIDRYPDEKIKLSQQIELSPKTIKSLRAQLDLQGVTTNGFVPDGNLVYRIVTKEHPLKIPGDESYIIFLEPSRVLMLTRTYAVVFPVFDFNESKKIPTRAIYSGIESAYYHSY